MKDTDCIRGMWIIQACMEAGSCLRAIPLRCKTSDLCSGCSKQRMRVIFGKFYSRFNRAYPKQAIDSIVMWTIGTSLPDNRENRIKLQAYWNKFRARMSKLKLWEPIFRVVESGKAGYLHIHFLNVGKLDFRIVIKAWRSITAEKSNVNFAKGDNGGRHIRYTLKYLTKSPTKYSFLGAMRGKFLIKKEELVCHWHGLPYEFERFMGGSALSSLIDEIRVSDGY